jgi:hypothetical protein
LAVGFERNKTVTTEYSGQHGTGSRRSIWIAAGVLVALLGMAAAWRWTPLADQIDIGKVTAWARALRSNPSRVMIILGAYLFGSIISLPITILILATALVFGANKRNHLFVHRMYDRLSGDIRNRLFSWQRFHPKTHRS